jgi:DNA-directed RNA polymerase specialized sigma24 family protein
VAVVQIEQPADDQWRALTKQLVAVGRRRHGVSPDDVEDRAQDALLRLVRDDPQAASPPSPRYANQALKLAVADEARRDARQMEVPRNARISIDDPSASTAALQVASEDEVDSALLFMETVEDVLAIVGHDAVELSMKSAAGWTEAEIEAARSLDSPTAGALRKRVSRAIPELAARLDRL